MQLTPQKAWNPISGLEAASTPDTTQEAKQTGRQKSCWSNMQNCPQCLRRPTCDLMGIKMGPGSVFCYVACAIACNMDGLSTSRCFEGRGVCKIAVPTSGQFLVGNLCPWLTPGFEKTDLHRKESRMQMGPALVKPESGPRCIYICVERWNEISDGKCSSEDPLLIRVS